MGSNSKGTGVRTLVGQSDWTVSVSFGDPRYNLSMREKKTHTRSSGGERERETERQKHLVVHEMTNFISDNANCKLVINETSGPTIQASGFNVLCLREL